MAGIVLGQVILYGPSLAGRKVLLPVDYLPAPDVYTAPVARGCARRAA